MKGGCKKIRDEIKNSYCSNNKIPLLRLPYTLSFDDIKINYMNIIYP
jgi:hypothetical protein